MYSLKLLDAAAILLNALTVKNPSPFIKILDYRGYMIL